MNGHGGSWEKKEQGDGGGSSAGGSAEGARVRLTPRPQESLGAWTGRSLGKEGLRLQLRNPGSRGRIMTLTSPLGSKPVKRKRSKADVVGLILDTAAMSRCGVGMGQPSCGLWTQNQSELPGLPLNVPSLPPGQAPHRAPSRARAGWRCPLQAGEVEATCMHLHSSLKHLRQGTPSGA